MIPLLDDFIDQLESWFKAHKSTLTSLYSLTPSVCSKKECNFKEEHFELYQKFLDLDSLEDEFQVWQTKWRQQPENDLTTSTTERIFATVKRLKTYLRNSTSQERLTGLALMQIHLWININTEEVINLFASKKVPRLNLLW
ncbi:hypothetical protein PR048_009271 [Dryococelus australis]|uniref:Transposase n=1 Tax=Dryococelus australis TaxID=614101 RepID=A0ABQ9HZE7_9NEOP|nr:hypothetical protein PR048_009271 [Dryococelus australis]